ncbi:hypothetical protein P168DRAFT_316577 [Aspergillus campestris IBT 28561]|uniref:Uncharacterized protein n=1 Tax=Aspergillus campestris (strain IBT 28561) TaxID=1392248 RepID=A0A2I1D9P5_ASPC2|nr:uncharacterized protein P168DRAFT_316577 [Aspergillus campestris IBT 28561]PKY06577.1 hypothetical protein P168DRAFT_316577 [Aspergillus campestris IBT 28561]
MPRVPTTKEVVPGAPVNIVLKADQPTGRTVSGTIAAVLTRGNHPRGIKVRLTDGRVGRVQSMGMGGNSQPAATATEGQWTRRGDPPGAEVPSSNVGLDAYVVNARPRQNRRNERRDEHQDEPKEEGPTVTCPVCGDFEGDETAVAHHVAGHFAD